MSKPEKCIHSLKKGHKASTNSYLTKIKGSLFTRDNTSFYKDLLTHFRDIYDKNTPPE